MILEKIETCAQNYKQFYKFLTNVSVISEDIQRCTLLLLLVVVVVVLVLVLLLQIIFTNSLLSCVNNTCFIKISMEQRLYSKSR